MTRPSDPPPFERWGSDGASSPLVIAVPHAGRHYPARIEADRAVARSVLEELEDRHADRLVTRAVEAGAVAIVATQARCWIDLNRGAEDAGEPDSVTASARAKAGLGLVPARIGGRPLWRHYPAVAEVEARIASIHAPYHRAIGDALEEARARHGAALLIDCHSMPPLGRSGRRGADIVIGDRHGATAASAIAAAAAGACREHDLNVAHNVPYAGAFTIQHHACPARNIHAIQVEVDRSLYLAPGLREPSSRMEAMAGMVADLCWSALSALGLPPQAMAAE